MGTITVGDPWDLSFLKFPFNWDPQRVGTLYPLEITQMTIEFPFNWDPQRVGTGHKGDRLKQPYAFPFNWDPQRVGTRKFMGFEGVSASGFHSIGIPSEWGPQTMKVEVLPSDIVSIQLGSPASGDPRIIVAKVVGQVFPFNWDPQRVGTAIERTESEANALSFHSIGIPSEWGPPPPTRNSPPAGNPRFHSIGIPSEWGRGIRVYTN